MWTALESRPTSKKGWPAVSHKEPHRPHEHHPQHSPEENAPHPHKHHPPTDYMAKYYPHWFVVAGIVAILLVVLVWLIIASRA